jgi:outer membrane scaffolding protein for murein synthesis (MipA/OmpV family)
MRKLLFVSASIAFCLSAQAFAQSTDDEKYIGIGARARPAYDGADGSRGEVIPYLRLYGDHLFARTTQGMLEGGWRTRPFGAWVFGAQVAYEEGRVTDDSAFLKDHHFDDLDPGTSIGLHAEADWKIGAMPLNALVRYRQNIDPDQGAQADLRLTAGIFSRWGVEAAVFGQMTWANGKSTQSYFGITPQQSAVTGLPVYAAGSGLRHVQLGLLGSVNLSRHWLIPAMRRSCRTAMTGPSTPASPIVSERPGNFRSDPGTASLAAGGSLWPNRVSSQTSNQNHGRALEPGIAPAAQAAVHPPGQLRARCRPYGADQPVRGRQGSARSAAYH